MYRLIVLIFSIFLSLFTFSQTQITGKVIDFESKQSIPYVSIKLYSDSLNRVVDGTSTNDDGNFNLITSQTNYFIEISFIGFLSDTIREIDFTQNRIDVGIIELKKPVQDYEEVVIQAEKSTTEFKLDKRVFNVGKDLSSTGASALEVLNNVPSVNVDIEGAISLRGSGGVQVLINGKPSVLANEQGGALGSITADMIEKVEVITNPSAKYDAEGSSGIINIVLKKEERKGVNGSISLNTGLPQNHSVGLSLNYRTEKFNLFSQLGAGYRELPRFGENINRDLLKNTAILSEGEEYRNEQFYNVILGTDYLINDRNVLTLSGSVSLELEKQPSETNFSFEDSTGTITSQWQRTEETSAVNPKFQYELVYKSTFKDNKDHVLLLSAQGNFFGKEQESEFFNRAVSGNANNEEQLTYTNFQEAKYTFNADYTRPFKKYYKLETGAQYVIQDVFNDFSVTNLVNGAAVVDSGLTNLFNYNQNVLGVYATGSYEGDKFGVKLGLRAENTDLRTELANTGEKNNQNFTNLFPTVHTSYAFSKRFSVQVGYSRRIYRPRLWDLNPFFNIRNSFSIRAGNPNLLPEFTDSYEVSSIFIFKKVTLNLSVYQKNTFEVIERISTFNNGVNTTSPENIGENYATGSELNVKYSPFKKMDLNGNINYNYFSRDGALNGTSFDFSADRWSTKWTAKFDLPLDFAFEVTGQYESAFQTVQGNVQDQLFADLGIRKKFNKGKTVISLGVRDVFASRIRISEVENPNFYLYSKDYRGRFLTLGFSYGFGKGEAMQYSGNRRR
ncbi:MAG: TonB-dependent receptor domain-containing protein [Lishizhenia sp.]